MNCPTCDLALHEMGCHTTASPMYWCLNCGTFRTCEGEVMVPVRQRKVAKTGSGCPSCGHTMHGIGHVPAVGGEPVFWCPRCGTLEDHTNGIMDVGTPKLVERCREFEKGREMRDDDNVFSKWHMLGIAESINLPSNRSST